MRKSALELTGEKFRTEGISRNVCDIMVSPIKEMRIIAQKFDNVISFGQGIPYLDTPKIIKEKLTKVLLEKDISKYTVSPGLLELRQKIAQKLKSYNIIADPNKEILVTAGAMEAVFAAVMTLVQKGDEVLMFTPCFPSYIELTILAGGKPVFSSLSKDGWNLDLKDIKKKITRKTKAMILCNPNNPTGTVFPEKDQLELTQIAYENDIFIISDDPYNFLVYEGRYFSVASVKRIKKNTISCFSFSKEFAMTGYRVGYAIAPQEILNQMMKVHDASTICAPAISQQAAIIALDNPDSSNEIILALEENRRIMLDGLGKIRGISYVKPDGAYYVLVKYPGKKNSVETALDILNKVQVECVPGSAFGPAGVGHIRLSFGGRPETIREGLSRLKKYFENMK